VDEDVRELGRTSTIARSSRAAGRTPVARSMSTVWTDPTGWPHEVAQQLLRSHPDLNSRSYCKPGELKCRMAPD
jgi:hypothetical protein